MTTGPAAPRTQSHFEHERPMAAMPAGAQQRDLGAVRLLIGASAIFVVLTAGLYAWTLSSAGPFRRDGSTLIVGRDFLNFWMYGAGGMDGRSEPLLRSARLSGRARGPVGRRLSRPELVLSDERHAGRRAVRSPALSRGASLLDRHRPRPLCLGRTPARRRPQASRRDPHFAGWRLLPDLGTKLARDRGDAVDDFRLA